MTDALDIAKKYLTLLKKSGIQVIRAYLFGSYAKGKVWEGSDIDVCIVSPDFGSDYYQDKHLLSKLALKIDPRIEPAAFSPEDFDNKYDSLADEIKRFGISLN